MAKHSATCGFAVGATVPSATKITCADADAHEFVLAAPETEPAVAVIVMVTLLSGAFARDC